jgi:5-methylcytosine-specific restriction endonuclease McrA
VVDHIIRVADGGPVFARSNLQRLCPSCAGQKTARGE